MQKEKVISIIEELKYEYSDKSAKMLERIGKAVIDSDAQSVSDNIMTATRYEAKADVLEELLERLESEE